MRRTVVRRRALRPCRVLAVLAAVQLFSWNAFGQATCFGKGSVMTCLDPSGGPAFQVNCFGTKYRTCIAQGGQQLSPSVTSGSSSSTTTTSKLEFNSPTASAQQSTDPSASAARSSADPAFGTMNTSPTDPASTATK